MSVFSVRSISTSSMIEEVSAQYLKELQAEKEELEKNYSENAHAIKLLQNGKEVIKDISWFRKKSLGAPICPTALTDCFPSQK